MTLIVTGSAGQVGLELIRSAQVRGLSILGLSREQLDITDAGIVGRLLGDRLNRNDVLINLAAFTQVDAAEKERTEAFRVNAHGVDVLASACAEAGAPLVHVSTDYVFGGGAPGPVRESDPTSPINVYGESKLAGEELLRGRLGEHLILRTSWVFGSGPGSFVHAMLRLAETQKEVRVVGDETGCPTGVADLAHLLLVVAERVESGDFKEWGTYHFCGCPPVSRADFAREIFSNAELYEGLPFARVLEISSEEYGKGACRPGHLVLDCKKIQRVFGVHQPDWRSALRFVLANHARMPSRNRVP